MYAQNGYIVPPGYSISSPCGNHYSKEYFVTSGFECPLGMSKNPESVLFAWKGRALQTLASAASAGVSQTDERWFKLAGHAAVPQGDDR
jgi:hypothetical protein